jgi:hypothetical protein
MLCVAVFGFCTPPASVVLTSARQFASKAEQQAQIRERERQRAEVINKRRAKEVLFVLQRSCVHDCGGIDDDAFACCSLQEYQRKMETQVMMGETNRTFIDGVLHSFFASPLGREAAARLGITAARDADADAAVTARVTALGFSAHHVSAALAAVGASQDAVLDWLCRHVPESELPACVDRRWCRRGLFWGVWSLLLLLPSLLPVSASTASMWMNERRVVSPLGLCRAFDPRGKQLEVLLPGAKSAAASALQRSGVRATDAQKALAGTADA